MTAPHPTDQHRTGPAGPAGPDAAVRHFERAFAGEPVSVAEARRFVRQALDGVAPASVCDDAAVCVSELATNAVRHTRSGEADGGYRVVLETGPGGRVHVEVCDQGADSVPQVLLGGTESGRGLWMCACLGVVGYSPDRSPDAARRVWVDLPHPAAGLVGGLGADGSERR